MTGQYTLFLKTFNKVAVLVIPTISIVALTAQETLAIPLKPIFDQRGNRAIKELLGVGSGTQAALQVSQPSINREREETSSPAASPDYPSSINTSTYAQTYPGSPPVSPAYPAPTYTPMYPQGYPGYSPGSPPVSPAYPAPTYTPMYPQGYPGYSPGSPPVRSSPGVIINNY
jgi:hypothetical protein